MDCKGVAAQCRAENEILRHVKAGLRLSLDLEVRAVGLDRKLSSVRFTTQSFRRHMQRLFDLEEDGGYMVIVGELKPHLTERAVELRLEHDEFRSSLNRIEPTMEMLQPDDCQRLGDVCNELAELLNRLDEHDEKESDLLLEACNNDEGGEG